MPHQIPRVATKQTFVVVGAGPAGLKAARVATERGHKVVDFEAVAEPGVQVRLSAHADRKLCDILDLIFLQVVAAFNPRRVHAIGDIDREDQDIGATPGTSRSDRSTRFGESKGCWKIVSIFAQ